MNASMFITCSHCAHYLDVAYTTVHDLMIPLIDNPKRVKGKLRFVKVERPDTKRQRLLIVKADLLAIAPIPDDAEELDPHEMEAA